MRQRFMITTAVTAAIVSAALTPAAFCGVTDYDLYKTQDFTQSSSAQPTSPFGARLDGRIFTASATDVTAASVSRDGSAVATYAAVNPTFYFFRINAPDVATLDASYPSGTYTVSLDAGTSAPFLGVVSVPDSQFASTVPYLTGSSYDNLQGMNPASPLAVTFNTYSPIVGHNVNSTFFSIFDNATGDLVFNQFGDAGVYTGDTIPAGLLQYGHTYTYSVIFTSRVTGPGEFDNSTVTAGFDLNTSGTFTTLAIPEPSMMLGLLPVAAIVMRRRSR